MAKTVYAFIDGQNFHKAMNELDWVIDTGRFRRYLKEHYSVSIAYYFIGDDPQYKKLHQRLESEGYELIKKPIMRHDGVVKGNCDTDLVFLAMERFYSYEKAILITSDGDYYRLIDYLRDEGKLHRILLARKSNCSALIKERAMQYITELNDLKRLLEYKKDLKMKAPPLD
jgi:uncharacterized LabA/DUF88 family protein